MGGGLPTELIPPSASEESGGSSSYSRKWGMRGMGGRAAAARVEGGRPGKGLWLGRWRRRERRGKERLAARRASERSIPVVGYGEGERSRGR